MSHIRHSRSAYTLIEAIVVIAIVGVLFSIIVPAIQLVRESANCAACAHKLRQIGIAFHHFDQEKEALPSEFGMFPFTEAQTLPPNNSIGSAFFQLLPYLGESNLYLSSFHDGMNGYNYINIKNKEVKVFICPSDPLHDRPGLGNYVVNECVFRRDVKPKYRLATIPDGASRTIICTETICRMLYEGEDEVREWAGGNVAYGILTGVPVRVNRLVDAKYFDSEWNRHTSSPHAAQPVLNADGAVHNRRYPIAQYRWDGASDPGDGHGSSTED